jgi:hypothetical protein
VLVVLMTDLGRFRAGARHTMMTLSYEIVLAANERCVWS